MVDLLALLGGLALGALLVLAVLGVRRGGRPAPQAVGYPAAPAAAAVPPRSAPSPADGHPVRVNSPPRSGTTTEIGALAAPAVAPAAVPAAGRPSGARLERSRGEPLDLGDVPVTIGRGADQVLRIADSRASRAHAVVRRRAKGGWELADTGSANGTRLNGHRIPEGRVAPLHDGDRIAIGPETITYRDAAEGEGRNLDGPSPDPDPTRIA